MQSDDTLEVDFVVGPDDIGEELLPEPAGRPLWRNPLLIAALAVSLVLLVLGGVRLASRHIPTPIPQAHAIPHAPAHLPPQVFGGPSIAAHLGPEPDVVVAPSRLRYCPDAGNPFPSCSITYNLPRAVHAALRDHLPRAKNVHGYQDEIHYVGYEPGGVLYRKVHARLGAVTLTIIVTRHRIRQPVESLMLQRDVWFSYHRASFYVRTIVHVHRPQLIPKLRFIALTRDPRLRTGP